jgi:hypothetical protein
MPRSTGSLSRWYPPNLGGVSTWLFLGALALATVGVLAFYGAAISGWNSPAPRTDLVSPEHFVRMRGVDDEIDLGRGWRSTDDPDAAWHVWWVPASGELIGLRTSELPPPPGPFYLGSVHGRSPLDPVGVHRFAGMRVLGHSETRPSRSACDVLRPQPDGLDLLCGGTHGAVNT